MTNSAQPQTVSPRRREAHEGRGGRALIAGAGHIGCHLLPLVARTGAVSLIRLIDRGRVTASHVQSEGYPPDAVGRFKSEVLAERWGPLFPGLVIESIPADLEDVPIGSFVVDVCLGALDSLRARQVLVSDRAFPLGVPVVDGGVGEGMLGRVHVFHPRSACMECRFGLPEYRTLATEYPCQPDGTYFAPSTTAPAFVGAAVAGVMTAEMAGILSGNQAPESSEIYFDLASRRFLTSRLRRARACRFDHQIVDKCLFLGVTFASATVGDVLRVVHEFFGSAAVQLEFRRHAIRTGDTFAAQRWVTPRWLANFQSQRLTDLGLTARDRIRASTGGHLPDAYIVLDHPSTPSGS